MFCLTNRLPGRTEPPAAGNFVTVIKAVSAISGIAGYQEQVPYFASIGDIDHGEN